MRPKDMDLRIWKPVDGHLFRSVPTEVPQKWSREEDGLRSGQYRIKRIAGARVRANTFELYRLGVRIGFAVPTLKAAKAHAGRSS